MNAFLILKQQIEDSEQQRRNSIFCQNVFLISNFSDKKKSGNNNGVTPFYITLKLMASEAKTKSIRPYGQRYKD